MENENNMTQNADSTYHFGRNESPYSREDVSGRTVVEDVQQEMSGESVEVKTESRVEGNPYANGNAYGQGIYTGNQFETESAEKKGRKKKKEKKQSSGKGKKAVKFVFSAAAFGLIAGCVMFGVNYAGDKVLGKKQTTAQQVATVATADVKDRSEVAAVNIADVAENVMPSIVSITNTSVQTVRSWFQSYEQEVQGSGSGIVIGQNNDSILIVTNNHVIDGAKELTVAFCDETAAEATVKGADSSADLAVLEVKTEDVEPETLKKIKVAALGSSDNLRVGEQAIAIGNALGYGQSVTVGYISAVNREVDAEDKTMKMLQTDAAINPGNSGGALLNGNGEVIGINTIKFVDSKVEGMGYAIPISSAIPIINDLMNQEVIAESEQGYLGIQGKDITDEYAEGFSMPKGIYVVKIVEGSPADECGLKAGDIIVKFGSREVASMETLQNILSNKKAGEEIEMIVQRNNEKGEYEEAKIMVTLGAKKDMPSSSKEQSTSTEEEIPEEYYEENPEMSPEDFYRQFEDFFRY